MKRTLVTGLLAGTASLFAAQVHAADAKNLIFFLGDGMGPVTVTSARIYGGEKAGLEIPEQYKLSMEQLRYAARVRTYSQDAQTTDSAPGMAGYITGSKSKNEVISMSPDTHANGPDGSAYQSGGDSTCPASGNGTPVDTLLEIMKADGRGTGVVSTTRITHATPATAYAHVCNRNAENTIAAQMVPGGAGYNAKLGEDGLDVVLGGGRRHFLPDTAGGNRHDARDLLSEMQAGGYQYVSTGSELAVVNTATTDKLLGLFNSSDLNYELDRVKNSVDEPSLAQMTEAAIDVLARNEKGYFLLVEGGRIDHALHGTNAKRALEDTLAFDAAIEKALEKVDLADTLIVVTADHDHVMAFNGYPRIANPILGLLHSYQGGDEPATDADGKPFTTLVFGNGGGARQAIRDDLGTVDTQADDYLQEVGVKLGTPGSETHGSGDVMLFADGAGSQRMKGTIDNVDVFDRLRAALGL